MGRAGLKFPIYCPIPPNVLTISRSFARFTAGVDMPQRRRTLDLIRGLNRADMTPGDSELAARLNAYDLAFKMQSEAPGVFDLSSESQETLDMYGVGKEPTDDYGRRCLMA